MFYFQFIRKEREEFKKRGIYRQENIRVRISMCRIRIWVVGLIVQKDYKKYKENKEYKKYKEYKDFKRYRLCLCG